MSKDIKILIMNLHIWNMNLKKIKFCKTHLLIYYRATTEVITIYISVNMIKKSRRRNRIDHSQYINGSKMWCFRNERIQIDNTLIYMSFNYCLSRWQYTWPYIKWHFKWHFNVLKNKIPIEKIKKLNNLMNFTYSS